MQQPHFKLLFLFLTYALKALTTTCQAQDMESYNGHWESSLPNDKVFNIDITIHQLQSANAQVTFKSERGTYSQRLQSKNDGTFIVTVDSSFSFKGKFDPAQQVVRGFVQSGQWQYHVVLRASGHQKYTGTLHLLLADHFHSPFYLSIENGKGEQYEAYAFSVEKRFPSFACYNFSKQNKVLSFNDFRSGMRFEGRLQDSTIELRIKLSKLLLTAIVLHRSSLEWNLNPPTPKKAFQDQIPANLLDGLQVGSLYDAGFKAPLLKKMVDSINTNQLTNIHSVLIARNGKLVYEAYFNGFDEKTPHDMRSASKSISGALIGIAIDKGVLKDTSQQLFALLPHKYQYAANSDMRKSQISIGNLLTMSSGMDAIDFGITQPSLASEDLYQQTTDWVKTIVEAPMRYPPGSHTNYGSANPFLLGVLLGTQLKQPLDFFIDDKLFTPLGIENYLLQNDCFGQPYFGGGMFLRSRDMLKFGLLYAQKGKWQQQQIVSHQWVEASFKNYGALENHPQKNEYGFLWWHYTYHANGKQISSIEARGAGGQYIFIIPEYQLVTVITSGNFRNGRVWQPEKIMEDYILPALQ
jgi:CubicO group peptidase (beta-lactamase class C family)